MRIKESVRRLVWVKANGMCAFPDCRKVLFLDGNGSDEASFVGEVAHIVGHSQDSGPRSESPVPGGDRDGEANLILLCSDHHAAVDRQVRTYTVERLLGLKASHEGWVQEQRLRPTPTILAPLMAEVVYSSLLSVDQLPRLIFVAPCVFSERDVASKVRFPRDRDMLIPYIVREKKLICFSDPREEGGPFWDAVQDRNNTEAHLVSDWLGNPDLAQWLVALLNRAIGKHAARLGLMFDKDHKRHYFAAHEAEGGLVARSVTYRPLNQASSTKQVAWNPVRKKTGEPKRHWIHLAASLRFHRVSPGQLVLSVRPEHRFTTDGVTPLTPKGTGKRATSTKSRMYNHELLSELQFWRSYLTRDQPRLILKLGNQSLVVDGQFLAADVSWPGVADDAKPFANADSEDDLFTIAAYAQALAAMRPEAEMEEVELDDIAAMEEANAATDDALSDDDFSDDTPPSPARDGAAE